MKTGSVIHYGANDYSIYRDAWALGDKRSAGDGREMFQACGLNGLERMTPRQARRLACGRALVRLRA